MRYVHPDPALAAAVDRLLKATSREKDPGKRARAIGEKARDMPGDRELNLQAAFHACLALRRKREEEMYLQLTLFRRPCPPSRPGNLPGLWLSAAAKTALPWPFSHWTPRPDWSRHQGWLWSTGTPEWKSRPYGSGQ